MSIENLENLTIDDAEAGGLAGEVSRGERKARKLLEGLGLKKVQGIQRVVVRRPKGVLLVIAQPEVFKSPGSDCYIVFGEAKVEDPASAAQMSAQAQLAASTNAAQKAHQQGGFKEGIPKELADLVGEDDAPDLVAADGKAANGKEADTSDVKVDEDDVSLVVAQTGCTPEKAREALKAEGGDLINASE
ncbi:hypothetical protein TREMEDRAFT_28397 [Tremella mesenterica DSM 1558]|uniref:uncharacterized protein n=1 Tax=Tremella mesenterica (strain ATCC 24925 / CBS 8224 / DSM 1558 / NBRC 9311 / NRRL Y-6157 / RJB 2259-6 / UBC 559-6) TaxID=578456 RepID=UPI0003F48F95|nr:uncharacterized protein TREMEDRAFT_28397 [Tremella mesenterica DSM 1558]EIW71348.1 hypothetical protein TREMEDRAFT_28397 [Tremella mesenterica DSM 1558]